MKRFNSLSALWLLLVSSLLFSLGSCKKDLDTVVTEPLPGDTYQVPAASPITGSVSGLVVNNTNQPVNGAEVRLGSNMVTTDANGLFSFTNVSLDKYFSTVTVTMPGFFKAYRSFSASTARNFLSVKLIAKTLSGTISSTAGGTADLSNGTALLFQANSIVVKSTGAAYTGTVNIYAAYIDPTADDIGSTVPGSFVGRDGNSLYALQSAGMIAVELESATGEALQLAAAKPATIQMPIPASLISKAPSAIDTWSLNEQGVWKKEGRATRSGNNYEMQATHFSFWNLDVPTNAIYLTLHVEDQNGNPISNSMVELSIPNNNTWWSTTYGYTDNLGNVSGFVPSGLGIEMNVFPNPYTCSTPLGTQNIGPFTANTSQTVVVNIAATQVLTVSGTASGCNNVPLQNGVALIYAGQNYYQYVDIVNGVYTANINHCSPITSLTVTIIDSSSSSVNGSGTITVAGNSVSVPDINVCGGSQNAVFTFGGQAGFCSLTVSGASYVAGTPLTPNNVILMSVNVTGLGNYQISTNTSNGFSFSGSGSFISFGTQMVELIGTGTPANIGTTGFTATSGLAIGCNFTIAVTNGQSGTAVFDLNDPVSCPINAISGSYLTGIPLDSLNYIAITINVDSVGSYIISTGPAVNGITFSTSGVFSQTGLQTVFLMGSGTPINTGNFTFVVQSANSISNCPIVIPVSSSGIASFNFGSQGTCNTSVSGTYTAGTALNSQNVVTLTVNVLTAGTYSMGTNSSNGISFIANGVFTSTGTQIVILNGQGTPQNTGVSTFVPTNGIVSGCTFDLTVN